MGDKPGRAKVSVALVGVGPTWELYYRDAIERLSSKLSIRAVCDSVHMRAAVVADEYEATPVSCPWQLTQRTDLRAWLILDPGWYEVYPADLAVRFGRPALFANTFASTIPRLVPTLRRSVESGEALMPEFPQRFTPATTRLRELMVTKLGRVRRIDITVPIESASGEAVSYWLGEKQAEAIALFDWCTCLLGDAASGATFESMANASSLKFQFPARATHPEASPVTIRFEPAGRCSRRIECERGVALISGPMQITWQTAEEERQEVLSHERSPHEIILDQFCRRALGGLVPVPTVDHALRAIKMVEFALDAIGMR